MNRIDRLTAILIQLQSQRIVRAEEIADRFEISTRTVYRDVKALMEAGVPIGSEAGTGYFIVDGYHLPPVMFTQDEAGALLLAGKLVDKLTDKSIRQAYTSALHKIKSVLHSEEKDHLEQLDSNVEVFMRARHDGPSTEFPDHFLASIQRAVATKKVLKIMYTNSAGESSRREIEPLGVSYYGMAWHLIGWCRLRKEYRDFRSDRIRDLVDTGESFAGHDHISLKEYFQTMARGSEGLIPAVITFHKEGLRGRPLYGSVKQTDLGDRIRAEFLLDSLDWMARWLLMFGSHAEIESPEKLRKQVGRLVEELREHHGVQFENLRI
jgi:predicted DNA-binding transcriptional regulator YafY